mmetsp:Transcript_76630/g.175727  ORF Transcript_76630/g.175727 Transcript_76630/m.175727 type:complete len:321 (-) Transcript_76630:438-1400(-)
MQHGARFHPVHQQLCRSQPRRTIFILPKSGPRNADNTLVARLLESCGPHQSQHVRAQPKSHVRQSIRELLKGQPPGSSASLGVRVLHEPGNGSEPLVEGALSDEISGSPSHTLPDILQQLRVSNHYSPLSQLRRRDARMADSAFRSVAVDIPFLDSKHANLAPGNEEVRPLLVQGLHTKRALGSRQPGAPTAQHPAFRAAPFTAFAAAEIGIHLLTSGAAHKILHLLQGVEIRTVLGDEMVTGIETVAPPWNACPPIHNLCRQSLLGGLPMEQRSVLSKPKGRIPQLASHFVFGQELNSGCSCDPIAGDGPVQRRHLLHR